MIKPFNELEELLEELLAIDDKKTKAFVLLKSFESSLESPNPVQSMNEMIELLRSIKGIKKIAIYKLLLEETSRDPITEIKNKIQKSYIFKRQNN